MADNSLINLGELSRPATVLVEKISDAVGAIAKPGQIVRIAKAEAQAARVHAETDIEIAELRQRAAYRSANEETIRQANMESTVAKAIPQLSEDSSPEKMEDDWVMNFFDKCRSTSDEDIQNLWARILAGEANNPGSFSRKTVNLMADLDKRDAEMFRELCGFAWMINRRERLLVFDFSHQIYKVHGVNLDNSVHLETLGLVRVESVGFEVSDLPEKTSVFYHGRQAVLTHQSKPEANSTLSIGQVLFTVAGRELFLICTPEPVDGFFEYVYDKWVGESFVPPRDPNRPPLS